MTLYYGKWKIMDSSREVCMTYFGSMSEVDDANDSQGVEVLGRWCDLGSATGHVVCRADDYSAVCSWLYNWVPMATIDVKPICDDNVARRIVLGKDPPYIVDYSNAGVGPELGETLYSIEYEFYPDKRVEGSKLFANLTQKQDQADSGTCRPLGRWHDLGTGSGFAIAGARSEGDVYAWAHNWAAMCKCKIKPVLTDSAARLVITSKPDYASKLKKVRGLMSPQSFSILSWLCYPFYSKTPGHADGL